MATSKPATLFALAAAMIPLPTPSIRLSSGLQIQLAHQSNPITPTLTLEACGTKISGFANLDEKLDFKWVCHSNRVVQTLPNSFQKESIRLRALFKSA